MHLKVDSSNGIGGKNFFAIKKFRTQGVFLRSTQP